MAQKSICYLAVAAALAATVVSSTFAQTMDRSSFIESERAIYLARAAEKQGDVDSAASEYLTAISYLESAAPVRADLTKLKLCGEPVPSIGRRMVYYQIKQLHQELAKKDSMMSTDVLLKNLRNTYGKMAWIEKQNPTWPYLEAVALAADSDYRAAFQKCREAAKLPGGEESVRQKARTLAAHIKDGALAQEQMAQDDKAVYEEYVRSGAQTLDFAMVSARCSADEARKRGDLASASTWESRYEDFRKRREQIKIR